MAMSAACCSSCGIDTEPENPLSVTLILAKVLSYLNVPDVKLCRLVCKMWNCSAVLSLTLKTRFDVSKLSPKEVDSCVMSMHKGLCLPPVNFVYSFGSHKKQCEKFMNFYGSRVKTLQLCPWKDEEPEIFTTDRFYLSRILMTPLYLRSLSLDALPDSIVKARSLFPRPLPKHPPLLYVEKLVLFGESNISFGFLLDLLFAMPNLGDLCVVTPTKAFLTTLMEVFNTFHFFSLVKFEIRSTTYLTTKHLVGLQNSKMKFKSLKLTNFISKNTITSLETLLETLLSSLEELHLPSIKEYWLRVSDCKRPFLFPYMEALKKLVMEDWNSVGPISFLKSMPNLDTLALEKAISEISHSLIPNHIDKHENLRELTLPTKFWIKPEDVKKILTAFPKLETLSVLLLKEAVTTLWDHGTNLKSLRVYGGSYLDDSSITGLTMDINSFAKIHTAMLTDEIDSVNHLRNSPFIGNLKNLEVLQIPRSRETLSDISIIFGIATLPNLKTFSLQGSMITDFSLNTLKKLPLVNLELKWESGPIFVSYERLQQLRSECPYLHLQFFPSMSKKFISQELGTKLFSNPWFYYTSQLKSTQEET